MNSPYKYFLEKLQGQNPDQQVIIQRAGTPDLKAKIIEVAEDGCTVASSGSSSDSMLFIFIAYENICGVGYVDWDLEAL